MLYRKIITQPLTCLSLFLSMAWVSVCWSNTITVSGPKLATPHTWAVGDRLEGASIELAERIFGKLGLKVKTVVRPWKRALLEIESGELDVVLAASDTKERRGYMLFSDPYYTVQIKVFVKKGREFPLAGLNDLKGKTRVAFLGATYGDRLDDFSAQHLQVHDVNSVKAILEFLEAERADFGFFPSDNLIIEISALGYENKIVALDKTLQSNNFHIGISQKSKYVYLLPEINEAIKRMRSSGEITAMVDQSILKLVQERKEKRLSF